MTIQEELDEFIDKVQVFAAQNTPSWLTSNSNWVGIEPGHNLDLLKIGFDFVVDRTTLLWSETPNVLKDPSRADLGIVK